MCVVNVLSAANVPVTSLRTKFALKSDCGASAYLNPILVNSTLSTAPMSVVVASSFVLVPSPVDTETVGNEV